MNLDACPSPDNLDSLLLGKTCDVDRESFEMHFSSCEQCLEAADSLESKDELSDLLRVGPSMAIRDELAAIIDRGKELITRTVYPDKPRQSNELPEDQNTENVHPSVGRYRIERQLGRGAFAMVYEACDEDLGRKVAIKVTHRVQLSADELGLSLREAQLVAALDHPHIVPVYDVGQTDRGQLFIVSKRIDGQSLRQYLRLTKLGHKQIIQIAIVLAEALAHAHQRGIYHRDLKPENVLVDSMDQIYLADFGLAVHHEHQRLNKGQVAGTPAYMSPEQIRGEAHLLDGRSDVWSLGVMIYEMLTDFRPFHGSSDALLFEDVLQREPVPLGQADPDIPKGLQQIVDRCLRKEITARYTSATDLKDDLQQCLTEMNEAGDSRFTGQGSGPGVSHLPYLVLMTTCAALVVVVIVTALTFLPSYLQQNGGVSSVKDDGLGQDNQDILTEWNIRVWNEVDLDRNGLSIQSHSSALPIQEDDGWQIEFTLHSPQYVYLVWIDSRGVVTPIYPWQEFDWTKRPKLQRPVSKLMLPRDSNRADDKREVFSLDEGRTDCIIILARPTPLPESMDLCETIQAIELPKFIGEGRLIEFDHDDLLVGNYRAPGVRRIESGWEAYRKRLTTALPKDQFPILRGIVIRKR